MQWRDSGLGCRAGNKLTEAFRVFRKLHSPWAHEREARVEALEQKECLRVVKIGIIMSGTNPFVRAYPPRRS